MRLLPIFLVKTFSVLFLCSSPAAAQQTELDSLKEKILKMDVAINALHHNMVNAHKQFRTGTALIISGTVLSVVGFLMTKDTPENAAKSPGAFVYIGGGMTLAGGIIQLDSHKWFGRGGRMKKKREQTRTSQRHDSFRRFLLTHLGK